MEGQCIGVGPERGGGGIANNGGTATVIRSTVDNNSAVGGGFRGGGGIENIGGNMVITNSTISGNELTGGVSSGGGGIRNGDGATLNLRNVTIANNTVVPPDSTQQRRGGGIFDEDEDGSTVTLIRTFLPSATSVRLRPFPYQRNDGLNGMSILILEGSELEYLQGLDAYFSLSPAESHDLDDEQLISRIRDAIAKAMD